MRAYAGVIVLFNESVLLVREPDFFTGEPRWTLPSGKIEDGESPAAAASRELAEESGCVIDPADLQIIATADVEHQGERLSRSWNFTAATTNPYLEPADPDHLVTNAEWFDRRSAIAQLAILTHHPKSEPAIRFLDRGTQGLHWTFELVDPTASIPSFRWDPPKMVPS